MAFLTDHPLYTSQMNRKKTRNAMPSHRTLVHAERVAKPAAYTFDATPSGDDDIRLCFLPAKTAYVIPEKCRVTSLNGAINGSFRLEKLGTDGTTVTALTGAVAVNDDSVAFTRPSGNALVQVNEGELLILTITAVTAIVSGDIVEVLISYLDEEMG
jgi:hypothetical protein